jgi:hypothetical protein
MNDHSQPQITKDTVKQLFDDVHTELQAESGYGLDAQTRADAWRQVQLYMTKLYDAVASHVTETEVPLTLMNNKSAGGRKFTIHGVVDIVQEHDKTILYDIKSIDNRRINEKENLEKYTNQLNVYAYMLSELRGRKVDQTCIINTDPPQQVKSIVDFDNMTEVEREWYERWEPVIPITNFSAERVHETIRQFGNVVDAIESGVFDPPSKDELMMKKHRWQEPLMCAKCDARFSCSSYRALTNQNAASQRNVMRFYDTTEVVRAVREEMSQIGSDDVDPIIEETEMCKDDAAANYVDDDGEFA